MTTQPEVLDTAQIHRVSPLLERAGKTRVLPFAPAPWVLQQCLTTGLIYLENPPDYAAFQDEFAWEVTYQQELLRRQAAEPWLFAVRSRWKRFRSDLFSRSKVCELSQDFLQTRTAPRLTMVELGCAGGENLLRIMRNLPPAVAARCAPLGVELSRQLALRADRHLQNHHGACLHDHALGGMAKFSDGELDLILMSSLLEHEINPLPLLRICREKLQTGGRIVIKVPNFDCFNRQLRGARWCGFRWPDHVNYFTPQTLRKTIEQAGLRIARMRLSDQSPLSDNMYAVAEKT